MKKKIAFIFSYKFSNIYTKKYQLENLSKFFNIIVYDLSKIYSPYLKKNIKINSRFKPNKLFILNNLSDFKSSLKKNLSGLYFFTRRYIYLFRANYSYKKRNKHKVCFILYRQFTSP